MSETKVGRRVSWRADTNDSFSAQRIKKYGQGPFEVVGESAQLGPAFCDCEAMRRLFSGSGLPQHEQRCAMYQMKPAKLIVQTLEGPQEFSADLFEPFIGGEP